MLKEIIIAIQAYFQAHRFISRHKLWKWILIPGIIYALLFLGGMILFVKTNNYAIDQLMKTTGLGNWMKTMEGSFLSLLFVFGQFILYLIMLMFYFSLFKYLFLIIGSPLFAYLSEKTAAILEGKDFPFSFSQLLQDIIRGVRLAARNTLWQTVYTISILILSFIPILGWFTPLIAMLIECYYLGFSMLDYSCERNKLTTTESISFIGKHKGLAIGNGIVFFMMHGVLFVGWVLAPSYAVVAATLSLYKTPLNKN